MKKRVMLLVLAGILSIAMSYAQTVTKSANGAIIDASVIPHTKVKKAKSTDGTNNTLGLNWVNNIGSAVNNEKVYYKLEVYKSDDNTSSNWLTAVNLCKDLPVDGSGWRLPTQRELMLIWVLKPELENIGGFVSFSANSYWSATEDYAKLSWVVDISTGFMRGENKANGYRARCVRDL